MPELVFKSDGRVFRRPFELTAPNEQEMQVDDAILAGLATNIIRKLPALCVMPQGPVGMSIINAKPECFFSVQLSSLNIHTTIEIENGIAVPTFTEDGDKIRLVWPVPDNMRLFLCGLVLPPDLERTSYHCNKAFLYAFSGRDAYLLPLANLYADGRICTGLREREGEAYFGPNAIESFYAMVQGFHASEWGAHLLNDQGDGSRVRARKFFRFKPTDSGFVALPGASGLDWVALCKSIGTDTLTWLPVAL